MNKQSDLVSIIMAAYDAEKTIECAIESVLAQTYKNWELLVINDCSTDQTPHIVRKFAVKDSRVILLNNEKNSGVSKTREKGMHATKGQWIAVLDSDDAWKPEKLEKQLVVAEKKRAELIFTGSAFMAEDGSRIDWQLHVPETLSYRKLLKQNIISNSSVLVKSNLYKQFYAIGDRMHEDFAIWLGITKNGRLAYGIDEPLLIYRVAKSSKSGNKVKAAKMNWKTYRYVGLKPIEAFYYECWYAVKGVLKYRHLK